MKKYSRDLDSTSLTVRLKPNEAARFWRLFDMAMSRNDRYEKSDVIRDLLGISAEPVLTDSEVEYFRNGKKLR